MEKAARISQLVDSKQALFIEAGDKVWATPELGFKEFKSAKVLVDILKAEGFTVEEGVAGIPTAFVATYGSGKPCVGLLGEYDALPSLSQKAATPAQAEVEPDGNGHGCGHNLLGAGALGAAVAVKDYLKETGMTGTVKFFGCPGEETGSGKMFMARAGVFDCLDAAFTWHPGDKNCVQGTSSQANICALFHFKGRTSHAAASPHLGRSALDGCEIMNIGCNYLREHMLPSERIHYAYTDVGGTAPNVVQDRATVFYYARSPKVPQVLELFERIKDVARGAALITGTQVEVQITDGLCDYVPNDTLSKLLDDCFRRTGAPQFDEDDKALAELFQKEYSPQALASSRQSNDESFGRGVADPFLEGPLAEGIIPYVLTNLTKGGSTDVGDVSYCVPTAQLNAATWAVGTPGHTWQVSAQASSSYGHKGMLAAAKAMALAAVEALANPQLLAQAKEEYVKVTGGKYICPVPDDVMPILD